MIMNELWKDIEGFEGLYQISNTGIVKSLPKTWVSGIGKILSHNGIIIKQSMNSCGYMHVRICKNKAYKTLKVHRLVASAFLENNMNYTHVHHIDNNKLNNNLSNLMWCSGRQNAIWKNELKNGKTSKHVGVDFNKKHNKYRARIIVNGFQKSLGYYNTEDEARLAYVNAVRHYDGITIDL